MEENEHGEVIEEVQTTELKAAKMSEEELRAELERIKAEAERKSKNNAGKIIMIAVIIIALTTLGVFGIMALRDVMGGKRKNTDNSSSATNESVVSGQAINLSEYSDDARITAGGEYVLTGEINSSVIVDSAEDVVLKLNGATISASRASAIASVGRGGLTIEIVDGTDNTLSDGGDSEWDGCIFSNGPLTINGNGKLTIYGRQNDGEGIATKSAPITINGGGIYIESNDDGLNTGGDGGTITINDGTITIKAGGDGIDSNQNLVINGGTVIVIGSDMLETPSRNSKQNVLAFNLPNVINNGVKMSLVDTSNDVIVGFVAQENFRTLIISSPKLVNGNYALHADDSAVSVNGATSFAVNDVITVVGSPVMGPGRR